MANMVKDPVFTGLLPRTRVRPCGRAGALGHKDPVLFVNNNEKTT